MTWQEVARRGRAGNGKGGQRSGAGDLSAPQLEELAQQLRAALMPKSWASKGGGRQERMAPTASKRPEWTCPTCGTTNFMTRWACRQCPVEQSDSARERVAQTGAQPMAQKPTGGPTSLTQQRLPPGSVWADSPQTQRPAARIAALEKARSAASHAGAPEDALVAMDRELADLRSQAASSRPLGARLDSAKAKLAKAESKVEAADAQLARSMQQLEEARRQRRAAEEALTELQAEVPLQARNPPEEWARSTRLLLEKLESGSFAASASMPQEIIAAMTAVHDVINAFNPVQAAKLDGPLEAQQAAAGPEPEKQSAAADSAADSQEDDVMGSLDGVDEADDHALLAIARRLKRARRA